MEREPNGGNIGKYQRVKGGKTAVKNREEKQRRRRPVEGQEQKC